MKIPRKGEPTAEATVWEQMADTLTNHDVNAQPSWKPDSQRSWEPTLEEAEAALELEFLKEMYEAHVQVLIKAFQGMVK